VRARPREVVVDRGVRERGLGGRLRPLARRDLALEPGDLVAQRLLARAARVALRSVAITGERVNERRRLNIGPWVRGRLLLFDLGYFKWQLFERIKKNGGYFVSRLRDDANPLIIGENRRWRGASRHLAAAGSAT
jgi:IS4 transposase